MSKLGEIVRCDLGSGLQSQTYNLCRMLKPDKLLLINSHPFNGHIQVPEMYEDFDVMISEGFPTTPTVLKFLKTVTHIITAETFYSHLMVSQANLRGIKTFQQFNYEFCEHLQNEHLPKPYKWLAPSYWHLEDMQAKFKNVEYLPPPIFMNDFKNAREKNWNRVGRRKFVHIMGKVASFDRNGTYDLLAAMQFSTADFELVIRSQYPVPEYINYIDDPRITWDIRNIENPEDLYSDVDAMILPRRYGGLCLPMNEALCSGIPVIMSDVSPNNRVLPSVWLVDATKTDQFMARTQIDVHSINFQMLGEKLDWLATISDKEMAAIKAEAFELGHDNYSSDVLKPHYIKALEL